MDAESTDIDAEDPDRTPGFLTRRNRQYLLGEWKPEYPEASTRSEIKVRTRHAFADLALLQKYGDEDLKHSILHLKEDERIMAGQQRDHLVQGVLRIALETATGEDFSDHLYETIEEHTLDIEEQDIDDLSGVMRGNPESILRFFFKELGDTFGSGQDSVSAVQASRILQNSWDS